VIDLHSHILPGIDDGAANLNISLEMARIAVTNGVTIQACTPHIFPGLYQNSGAQIRSATLELQRHLDERGVPLRLVTGADAHVVPNMAGKLREGAILSLADTRYVLVEPPHHVAPPRIEYFFFELLAAGYVPILTHPERLTWIETHYMLFVQLFRAGVWMQLTSGSLTGAFGRRPKYWAERMLSDGLVQILASDAHGAKRRRPDLADGRAVAAKWLGEDEAEQLVCIRPRAVLLNVEPSKVSAPAGAAKAGGKVSHDAAERNFAARRKRPDIIQRDGDSTGRAEANKARGFTDWAHRFLDLTKIGG
jgi:protein-tyrosine phosphatase